VHASVEPESGKQVLQATEAEFVYGGIDQASPEPRPKHCSAAILDYRLLIRKEVFADRFNPSVP
jgi:hypothetical protein